MQLARLGLLAVVLQNRLLVAPEVEGGPEGIGRRRDSERHRSER